MARFLIFLMSFLISISTFAHKGLDASNTNFLNHLDLVGDEVEGHAHRPKALNVVFDHLKAAARIIKVNSTYNKPSVVSDQYLMNMLNDMAGRIGSNSVPKLAKLRALSRLHLALSRLKNGRLNQAPVALGELEISGADPLNMGASLAGFVVRTTLTVTNVGDGAVTYIQPLAFEGPFGFYQQPYPGWSGTCGASLAVGASCTIVIQFAAPIAVGSYEGQMAIEYNDGVDIQMVTKALVGASI